ncbi:Dabb family protein [Brucella oryzae]|uniref:Stress responsive protein n=1 Tax=Brucella oryzae TaxID=335286 RepID=A0A2S7IX69_9HYPH|nr:Dabb family protein [Brucella oryzae]PQA72550.1 stress responsive protein [Brucella oryzae]
MIRHIVLIKFSSELDAAQIQERLQAIVALKDKIGGILSITAGENSSPENLEKGFRHGFVVDFADSAARDIYLPHPEHAKVGKSLVEAAEGGIEGILVFDYTL